MRVTVGVASVGEWNRRIGVRHLAAHARAELRGFIAFRPVIRGLTIDLYLRGPTANCDYPLNALDRAKSSLLLQIDTDCRSAEPLRLAHKTP
jgi:hypothetical protein